MLGALAQEARLEIFRLLVKAGPGRLAPATLSFHLKELRTAGIVICQKRGRSRIYSPDFESMKQLVGFLTEDCCRGLAA
jgi:DNA-binding transcriptional ArsR family regulator